MMLCVCIMTVDADTTSMVRCVLALDKRKFIILHTYFQLVYSYIVLFLKCLHSNPRTFQILFISTVFISQTNTPIL